MNARGGDGGGLGWLALLLSFGTLLCCALPIVLVSLGFGAAVAAFNFEYPLLLALAGYKPWMFTGSAALLLLAGWWLWWRPAACPADPELAAHCARARVWNRRAFWAGCAVWASGFFFAYLLLPLRIWLDT